MIYFSFLTVISCSLSHGLGLACEWQFRRASNVYDIVSLNLLVPLLRCSENPTLKLNF